MLVLPSIWLDQSFHLPGVPVDSIAMQDLLGRSFFISHNQSLWKKFCLYNDICFILLTWPFWSWPGCLYLIKEEDWESYIDSWSEWVKQLWKLFNRARRQRATTTQGKSRWQNKRRDLSVFRTVFKRYAWGRRQRAKQLSSPNIRNLCRVNRGNVCADE